MQGKIYIDENGVPFIDEIDGGGEPRKLGTIPMAEGEVPLLGAKSLGDAIELLDYDAIKKLLAHPDRIPARQTFNSDWILDQNGKGACQFFGTGATLERAMYRRTGVRVPLWCCAAYAREVNGADRGSTLSSGFRDVQEKGIPPMSARGGTKEHVTRRSEVPADAWVQGERFKGFEAYWIKTKQELVNALALGFPVVYALTAGGSYSKLDKYGIAGGGGGPGNHALCADDVVYDPEFGDFKIDSPNSWGTRWGDNGRHYVTWEKHLAPCLGNHGCWALPTALDDPQDPNLPGR